MSHPNHPNFFILHGPGTGLGHNSVIFMIECQVNGDDDEIMMLMMMLMMMMLMMMMMPMMVMMMMLMMKIGMNHDHLQASYAAKAIAMIAESGAKSVALKKEVNIGIWAQASIWFYMLKSICCQSEI